MDHFKRSRSEITPCNGAGELQTNVGCKVPVSSVQGLCYRTVGAREQDNPPQTLSLFTASS